MSERCVSLRKDGRACQGQGLYFHPERNGLVCDAHRPDGPGSDRLKHGTRLMALTFYEAGQAESERRREALALGLSDDSLNALLKALRRFRDGKRLEAKVRRILEDILTENTQRNAARLTHDARVR
jgi:hypothetical protein